jgi:3-hydroxyacyl-CoA dehydrogenase
MGARDSFSAGADITELGTPQATAEPNLRSLIREFERCETPIIAALAGTVMGGGLELALGCHYRVVRADAALALPEVKLGLLPGAGGTQRLPRAIGLEAALEMILSGRSHTRTALAALPNQQLIDLLVPLTDDLTTAAVHFARTVATIRPLPRLRDHELSDSTVDTVLAKARAALVGSAARLPAPSACIECVAASTQLPFDEGLDLERRRFLELMVSPESRALRHAFFAERSAGRVVGVSAKTPIRPIAAIGIIGTAESALAFGGRALAAGVPVTLVGTTADDGRAAGDGVQQQLDAQVVAGALASAMRDERLKRLTLSASLVDLANCDLVIDAGDGDLPEAAARLHALDGVLRPGAILTTVDMRRIDALARATARQGDVVGLELAGSVADGRLLEVVPGLDTTPDTLASLLALGKRLRMTVVVAAAGGEGIAAPMWSAYRRQASRLLDEGCTRAQIDQAMMRFGMTRLPAAAHDDGADTPVSTRGTLTAVPDAEVVERLLLSLINRGARLLESGTTTRASDIDAVFLAGHGFPAWRGGPMHQADAIGIWSVVRMLERRARAAGPEATEWAPVPLLEQLAMDGGTLHEWKPQSGA